MAEFVVIRLGRDHDQMVEWVIADDNGTRRSQPLKGSLNDASAQVQGRPVIVLHNDYRAGLFNGDTGICFTGADGHLRIWFRTETGLQTLLPSAMPAHETAYAMTVHKSQGSEFNRVLLILPDRDSPLLTRELLYTAITRGREKVEIWGRKSIFVSGVKRRIKRTSGLAEALWGEEM